MDLMVIFGTVVLVLIAIVLTILLVKDIKNKRKK